MNYTTFTLKMAYDTYADAVFRYCFLGSHDRTQALRTTQEVFISLGKHLERGEIVDVETFLFRKAFLLTHSVSMHEPLVEEHTHAVY